MCLFSSQYKSSYIVEPHLHYWLQLWWDCLLSSPLKPHNEYYISFDCKRCLWKMSTSAIHDKIWVHNTVLLHYKPAINSMNLDGNWYKGWERWFEMYSLSLTSCWIVGGHLFGLWSSSCTWAILHGNNPLEVNNEQKYQLKTITLHECCEWCIPSGQICWFCWVYLNISKFDRVNNISMMLNVLN